MEYNLLYFSKGDMHTIVTYLYQNRKINFCSVDNGYRTSGGLSHIEHGLFPLCMLVMACLINDGVFPPTTC